MTLGRHPPPTRAARRAQATYTHTDPREIVRLQDTLRSPAPLSDPPQALCTHHVSLTSKTRAGVCSRCTKRPHRTGRLQQVQGNKPGRGCPSPALSSGAGPQQRSHKHTHKPHGMLCTSAFKTSNTKKRLILGKTYSSFYNTSPTLHGFSCGLSRSDALMPEMR